MITFFIVMFLIAIIDQTFKYIVRAYIPFGHTVDTFLPFFKITNIRNVGAAFGSMAGMRIYLVISSLIIMAVVIYYIFKKKIKNVWFLMFLALILGGGLSNLYDRVLYGFVTDYLKLTFFPPICNLADYCICCGAVAVLIFVMKGISLKR